MNLVKKQPRKPLHQNKLNGKIIDIQQQNASELQPNKQQ